MMRTALLPLYFAFVTSAMAQARNANWVIANGVWMSFTDSSMSIQPALYTVEGRSSCISDTSGQFLLLVDNTGVRDAQFNLLAGASSAELGWTHPGSSYLILPKPEASGHYCILVNEMPPNARAGLVEVDLTANGGAGAVVSAGTNWYMQHTTSKLTATTDTMETGYWIVQHEDSSDAFHSYHLTSGGLDPVPVVSHGGRTYLTNTPNQINADLLRPMKFSFQGDKLAAITFHTALDSNAIELFHFNRTSGEVSFWAHIDNRLYMLDSAGALISGVDLINHFTMDCEFSIDGNHLYYTYGDTLSMDGELRLAQLDLDDPDPSAIQYSAFFAGATWSYVFAEPGATGAFVLTGLDGRIYQRANSWPGDNRPITSFYALPLQMGDLSGPDGNIFMDVSEWIYPPSGAYFWGLPNISKRYVDSKPITTGLGYDEPQAPFFICPNPVVGQSLVSLPGYARPSQIRWHNALGQVVMHAQVEMHGKSVVLDRNGLPSGIYIVELMSGNRSLGFVRVVCE